jgi:hypothetical protein
MPGWDVCQAEMYADENWQEKLVYELLQFKVCHEIYLLAILID